MLGCDNNCNKILSLQFHAFDVQLKWRHIVHSKPLLNIPQTIYQAQLLMCLEFIRLAKEYFLLVMKSLFFSSSSIPKTSKTMTQHVYKPLSYKGPMTSPRDIWTFFGYLLLTKLCRLFLVGKLVASKIIA